MKWRAGEIRRFIKKYPTTQIDDLLKQFPGRTLKSMEGMARRLRLKRIRKSQKNFIAGSNSSFQSDTEVSYMELEKLKLEDLLNEVTRRGFISTKREQLIDHTYKLPERFRPFKIGLIADTHFGSVKQQPTLCEKAYEIFTQEKVIMVLHAGDISDGDGTVYRGQRHQMFLHGVDNHIKYVVDNYPKAKFPTKFITGNHDESFYNSAGIDIGKQISAQRKDLEYLGLYGAYIMIGNVRIYLMHGDGGGAYAQSYKCQKICEKIPSGEKKPNILVLGHFHNANILPSYRNIYAIQMPAMQGQTPFARKKGLAVELGIVILEITPDEKGIGMIKTNYIPFFTEVEGDY
jgi:predicted phosphodiesterase